VALQQDKTFIGVGRAGPNPSVNTPTHYGRRRKPGLRRGNIVSVQAYGACLRGRGYLER
jgi:hypothetical protein